MASESAERALGRLEGKLDLIIDDQVRAREDRKQQYEKTEEMERLQSATDAKLQNVIKRLEAVEPVISKISNWEQRGIGVLMFLGFVSGTVGMAVGVLWKKFVVWMGWS